MRKLYFLLATAVVSISSFAQQVHRCGSHIVNEAAFQNYPELRVAQEELEYFTQNYTPDEAERSAVKVIPIVFHIIHNYGPENISREQVEDAVRIINEDFQLTNTDQSEVIPAFQNIIGNAQVEFRLARKDPNGNCTDGITRTVSTLTYNGNDNVKEIISWPRNKYLNVWIVDDVILESGDRVGGYAYRPGNAPAAIYDGIIVTHTQLGSIGTSNGGNFASRTLSHEIGHWFNLNHTWGPSNNPGLSSNCDQDDNVSDTPNTIGVADQSCNLSQITCGSLDNVQNIMDYANCAIMFSAGQCTRMNAALASTAGQRNNLWSSANLTSTGVSGTLPVCAPLADFSSSTETVCTNTNVTFTDESYNAEVDATWTWSWTFPGANPASSNSQNPVIQYTEPGVYPVTLTVANTSGNNSRTKNGFITVRPINPTISSPYVESFENASFPNIDTDPFNNWSVIGASNAFERSTLASVTGSASLRYNNNVVPTGSRTELVSPIIDMSGTTSPATITFKLAYARKNTSTNDRMEIYVSSNCGRTWALRYAKTGAALSTLASGQTISGTFNPTAEQWRTETVSVTTLAGQDNGMVKFVVSDSAGNSIFLEDINILNQPVGIEEITLDDFSTQVYPNPGNGDATISVGLLRQGDINISITDLTGKLIGSISKSNLGVGDYTFNIAEISGRNLSAGAYLVRIDSGSYSKTRKWICN
jgi:PKD repeat protein